VNNAGSSYQLLDATTHKQIAIIGNLEMAVTMARERGGAVWRENADNRGRPLGNPVLLPRASECGVGLTVLGPVRRRGPCAQFAWLFLRASQAARGHRAVIDVLVSEMREVQQIPSALRAAGAPCAPT